MVISEKKAANAMGGKTARACDGCLRKRARWYCVADDAFLCQACDASVHSANQLASRHERVRLETASCKETAAPVWHQGFTRKPRTPRPNNNNKAMVVQQAKDEYLEKVWNANLNESLVPEIGNEDGSLQEEEVTEEQLLYQVPVFDPFAAEHGCESTTVVNGVENLLIDDFGDVHGFFPTDVELAEFAADVESLLGNNNVLDEDSYDVKELGLLLDCKEEKMELNVKDEEVEGVAEAFPFDHHGFSTAKREAKKDWKFDHDDEQSKAVTQVPEMKRNISLKLNYDAVITAWASQGCPWTTGSRPDINPNECWPDCTGSCCKNVRRAFGGLMSCRTGDSNGGREARVSRYREKRRTRLFSKKIRYEVRKLNAEKRPRMKGRFVKSTSLLMGTNSFAYINNNNH